MSGRKIMSAICTRRRSDVIFERRYTWDHFTNIRQGERPRATSPLLMPPRIIDGIAISQDFLFDLINRDRYLFQHDRDIYCKRVTLSRTFMAARGFVAWALWIRVANSKFINARLLVGWFYP